MDQPVDAGPSAAAIPAVLSTQPETAAAIPTPREAATAKPNEGPTPKPGEETKPAAVTLASPKFSKKNGTSNNAANNSAAGPVKVNTPEDDEAEAEEAELTLTLPFAARVEKLKDFLAAHPDSKSKARATELLISAHAALGDQKLKAGDTTVGIEQMMLAVSDSPADMSDKLFSGVISQIPLNLYLRGERAEAIKAAGLIEAKIQSDPQRLLTLAGFYLGIERGDEAARIAQLAVKLAPDMADAHQALGLALHISLQLDDATAEYKRALELDPKLRGARRGLADLSRAGGKFDEALPLYRDQLTAEPADKVARAGLVLTLFELGKMDEAKQELEAALKDDARNLTLLVGAAYWLVAHGNSEVGLELARRAADIEPRYTWAQITLARALLAQRQPLYAERSLRFARQYGSFPTLDYELASTLASLGLYEEAAAVLTPSFTVKDGLIETQLASRLPAKAATFLELLAPERRASIFQPAAADTENNARVLKALLAFTQVLKDQGDGGKVDEPAAVAAAQEFAAAGDDMRAYRQLYAASRLLQRGIGFQAAQELADGARDGVDAALFVPAVTVAVQADELGDMRARAIAAGGTPAIPNAPRNVLANILRGRIEDLSGWALFNQDKAVAAAEHLRRAVSVLPEKTPSWRTALWHLGVALQQSGNNDEALSFYIKGYNAGDNDPVRRAAIESLYKKIKGSLDGLDERIGAAPVVSDATPQSTGAANANPTTGQSGADDKGIAPLPAAAPTPGPTPTPTPTPTQSSAATPEAGATPTPSPEPSQTAPPQPTPIPEPVQTPTPEPTPVPAATPEPTPTPAPTREATPTPQPTPTAPSTPEPSPSPTTTPEPAAPAPTPEPSPRPSDATRPRRVKPPDKPGTF
jgi:tetratricopeptide (TPR) repeat protein